MFKRENNKLIRKWKYTSFGKGIKEDIHLNSSLNQTLFTVASYNVLCQNLIYDHEKLYEHCHPEHLDWEKRKILLLKEIKDVNPDILCLQEVQPDHYQYFFLPELQKQGYNGIMKKRSSVHQDGCATFFKNQKFEMLEKKSLIFEKYHETGKTNIALLLVLRSLRTGSKNDMLLVSNTHIFYNPKRGDIKLSQLVILLAGIDELSKHSSIKYNLKESMPLLCCGDFNFLPFSDLYLFLTRGIFQFGSLLPCSISGMKQNFPVEYSYPLSRFDIIPFNIDDNCTFNKINSNNHSSSYPTNNFDISNSSCAVSKKNIDCLSSKSIDKVTDIKLNCLKVSNLINKNDHNLDYEKSNHSFLFNNFLKNTKHIENENMYISLKKFNISNDENSQMNQFIKSFDNAFCQSKERLKPSLIKHELNFVSAYCHWVNYKNNLSNMSCQKINHRINGIDQKIHLDKFYTNNNETYYSMEISTSIGYDQKYNCDYIFYSVGNKSTVFIGDKQSCDLKKKNGFNNEFPCYPLLKTNIKKDGKIKLVGRLELPSEEDPRIGPLPNESCGSDHLIIMAQFAWLID